MFRLILVEDEPRILRHLKEKIRTLSPDFKVVGTYNNGEDALVELHWTQPHALITDIRMPVMNGLELIQKIRVQLPDTQVAVLSGYDDYPYLREAIKLKITDYLLKPAADDEISALLEKIKDRLMHNQALLEREVARHIMEMSISSDQMNSEWKQIAKELFYHGNYIVVYASSLLGEIPADVQTALIPVLSEGEKYSPLPSPLSNELVLLFGVHTWSDERGLDWIRSLNRSLNPEDSLTVALALSTKGLEPITALLSECRKKIKERTAFESSCFWISNASPENIKPLLDPLQPAILRLAQFITKQQKKLFNKELDSFLADDTGHSFPITRKGWELFLLHISHSVHALVKDSFISAFEDKQSMELEVCDEIWKARKPEELYAQIKEIWGSYFFQSEHEQAVQRDWAREAKEYIQSHFHDNISLTNIADIFQLHSVYLNRVFKRAYQTSIPDYLLKLRMDEACRFIREYPFVLIKDIAEHVGYSDPFYFSKVFKQHTGFSPTDYKAKND